MMPIGPLMIEHRLTERMIALMKKESSEMEEGQADIQFLGAIVDFFRTYVDLCHHGKEEDILFRSLDCKELSPGHRQIMDKLLEDHARAREMVAGLEMAKIKCSAGDLYSMTKVKEMISEITVLYAEHIEKEDRQFFIPSMSYFSEADRNAMLSEMAEFDRQLIHRTYRDVVARFERRKEQ